MKADPQTPSDRDPTGFTLLELLVALAVLGFLLVGLSGTVRFGLQAWQQDARLSEGQTDLEAVDRAVRSVIENLAPIGDLAQQAIDGTATSISGRTMLRVPGSGLRPVPVEAGLALSGQRLVLRWRLYHHWEAFAPPPPPQETDLIEGVQRLRIEYWQAPGQWVPAWHEANLPLLIRLRITFAGDHPPRWPDIVAAPLLSRP